MLAGLVTVLFGHLIEGAKMKAYAAALYIGAAVSLLFAFVFALVALRHWVAITYHLTYPDLWMAAGFVVIAVPFIGFGIWMQGRRPKTHPMASIAMIAAPTAARLAARNATPRLVAVGVVLFAGLILGRRITARNDA